MKVTVSILASMVCTSITLAVLAACISLPFCVPYTQVVHSVPFGVLSFFTALAVLIYSGHECYELMEKKGY